MLFDSFRPSLLINDLLIYISHTNVFAKLFHFVRASAFIHRNVELGMS